MKKIIFFFLIMVFILTEDFRITSAAEAAEEKIEFMHLFDNKLPDKWKLVIWDAHAVGKDTYLQRWEEDWASMLEENFGLKIEVVEVIYLQKSNLIYNDEALRAAKHEVLRQYGGKGEFNLAFAYGEYTFEQSKVGDPAMEKGIFSEQIEGWEKASFIVSLDNVSPEAFDEYNLHPGNNEEKGIEGFFHDLFFIFQRKMAIRTSIFTIDAIISGTMTPENIVISKAFYNTLLPGLSYHDLSDLEQRMIAKNQRDLLPERLKGPERPANSPATTHGPYGAKADYDYPGYDSRYQYQRALMASWPRDASQADSLGNRLDYRIYYWKYRNNISKEVRVVPWDNVTYPAVDKTNK